MPTIETHKGRGRWTRWSGSPALIAEIAQVALEVVSAAAANSSALAIKVDSPAWESEFGTPEDFRQRLGTEELGDVTNIDITAQTWPDRQISVQFKRVSVNSKNPQEPVVMLNVAGDDRAWVKEATEKMQGAIRRGVPARRPWLVMLSLGLALLVAGIAFSSAVKHGSGHRLGVALLIAGGAIVALVVLPNALLPPLELLPEGKEPRRRALMRWGQREGVWLLRGLVLAAIGSGLTLLFQHI